MNKKTKKRGRPKREKIYFEEIPEEIVELVLKEFYKGGNNGDTALSRRLNISYKTVYTITTHEMYRLVEIMRKKGRLIM